jgi:hypothetical protein
MHLVTLLDKSVKGDSAGFQTWCEKEAAELANAAFGPTMLIAVRAWGEQHSSVLFTIVSHMGETNILIDSQCTISFRFTLVARLDEGHPNTSREGEL